MSEQNPQVRRPQTLENPETNPSAGNGTAGGPPSGVRSGAATYGLNSRPSGIRPLPELPPGPDTSFRTFGTLNAGEQSKATLFTSVTVNIAIAVIICLVGAAAKKVHDKHVLMTNLTEPIPLKKEEQPKPKPKPPEPKLPPPPPVIEPPKIQPPVIQQVKLDMPKPPTPVIKMATPVPVLAAAPLKVTAPAAPKLLSNLTASASVKNNDAHPSAVALGSMNNPMQMNRNAAPSKINLGNAGMNGMPASNSGHGPVSLSNSLGSGAPNGSVGGKAHVATSIAGLSNGVPGGQGTARTTSAVNIAPVVVQQQRQVTPVSTGVVKPPTITGKASPQCTPEAKAQHIEGQVALNVIFTAGGSVQVISVAQGLGHGLDQTATAAAQSIRFTPASSDGHPVDFKTVIRETFACAP